jgi:hypothetical protein
MTRISRITSPSIVDYCPEYRSCVALVRDKSISIRDRQPGETRVSLTSFDSRREAEIAR